MERIKNKNILFVKNSCMLQSHSQLAYGMGIVATIAHNSGYNVKVIDNNSPYKYYKNKDIIKIIKRFNPIVLGYSITLHNAYSTYKQMRLIKKQFPDLIIVAGGIHMRHSFEEALRNGADIVINKEAEEVIAPLLNHIVNNKRDYKKNLKKVHGVSFVKEDGSYYFASKFPLIKSLDNVPIVNYDLFNLKDFIKVGQEPGLFYVNGQRGCPFGCKFCSDEFQRKDKRVSSPEWLFNNIKHIYEKYRANYILIADNNITLDKDRLVKFCNMMIDSGLNEKITLSSQTTTRFPIEEDLIILMRKAGFIRISLGIERLTPYSLKQINKIQPLDNIHNLVALFSKHDISPTLFMMIGFPFETEELLEQEKKLFLEFRKYTSRLFLSVLAPTPGTTYYDDHPHLKEWYLDPKETLIINSYFANVLDMHTYHTIKRNYYNLPKSVIEYMEDYYFAFKKIKHGSEFRDKSFLLSFALKLDFIVAKISQFIFKVSPKMEFFLFNRLKGVRYYVGNYFFEDKIVGKKRKGKI